MKLDDDSLKTFCDSEFISAIVKLVRMLGPHPSDPGSSPGGGKHLQLPFPKKKRSKQSSSSIRPKQSIAIQTERGHIDATMHSTGLPMQSRWRKALLQLPFPKKNAQNRVQAAFVQNKVLQFKQRGVTSMRQCTRLPMQSRERLVGLFWELNPGPLAPEARIMPLDQKPVQLI